MIATTSVLLALFGGPLSFTSSVETPPAMERLQDEEGEQEGKEETPPVFEKRSKRLPPFFWYDPGGEGKSRFFMLMMLYWQADSPSRTYRTLIPLFYYRHNRELQAKTWAGPGFYFASSPDSKAGYIPPVYLERGPNISRTGVPPFFWYGRIGKDVTSYLFPFYYFDERSGQKVLATPLGGGWGTQDDWRGIIGPYYWQRTHTDTTDIEARVLFPVYWDIAKDKLRTRVIGPVFSRKRTTARGQAHAYGMFPLFYRRSSPGGSGTTITPLFVHERIDPQRSKLFTPIGGYSLKPDARWWVFGPYYYVKRRGGLSTGLAPIVFFHNVVRPETGERESTLAVLPLFFYAKRPEYRRIMAGLLFWHYKNNKDPQTYITTLFPLYFNINTPTYRLFSLPPYYRYREGRKFFEMVFPIWFHSGNEFTANTLVFPLFFVRKDRAFGTTTYYTPIGGVWTQREPKAWKALFPLVYLAKGPQKRTGVIFPIFWYDFDHKKQTIVIPPFFTRREPGYLDVGLIPLFYYGRRPGFTRLLTPGVFYNREGDKRTTFVVPAYLWTRDKQRSAGWAGLWFWNKSRTDANDYWRMLFPLFYQSRYGDRSFFASPAVLRWGFGNRAIYVAPGLGWATRRNSAGDFRSWAGLFGPLYLRFTAGGAGDVVLFPLAGATWQPEGWRVVTALGGAASWPEQRYKWLWLANYIDVQRGDERKTWVLPVFYRKADPKRLLVATPLFIHRRDKEKGLVSTGGPFFYYRRDPNETLLLSPGVFHVREGDKKNTIVLPLFVWNRDKTRSHLVSLGFGWAHRKNSAGEKIVRSGMVGPYYWRTTKSGSDRILFPLFWRTRGEDHTITAVAPLFLTRRDHLRNSRVTITLLGGLWTQDDPPARKLLAPLVYVAKGDQKRSTVVFPFFWYDWDHGRQTVVIPPFFTQRNKATTHTGLIPLFYHRKKPRETLLVSPLVIYTRFEEVRKTTIPLAMYHWYRDGERSLGMAGPWVWNKSLTDKRDYTRVLVPLFFQRGWKAGRLTVGPAFGWLTRLRKDGTVAGRAGLAGPLYWRLAKKSGDLALFPLAWHHWDHDRWRLITVLGGTGRIGEDGRWLWILNYLNVKTQQRRLLSILPLFWHHRDHTRKTMTTVAPLFYHRKAPGHTQFVTLGVIHRRDGDRKATLIAPLLYGWQRDEQRSTGMAGPWIWSKSLKRDDDFLRLLVPLYLQLRKGGRSLTAFPFLGWAARRNAAGEVISRAGLVGPVYFRKAPQSGEVVLFPLFWRVWSPNTSITSLLPLFYWDNIAGDRRLFTPVGGFTSRPGYHRSLWGPLYLHRDKSRDVHVSVLFPLFWNIQNQDRKFLLAFPYYHFANKGESRKGIFPLWFNYSSRLMKRTLVLPLFYSKTEQVWGRRTLVTPIFAYWGQAEPRSYKLLIPFFYRAKGPGEFRQTVVFPLWWHRHTSDRDYVRALFPIFLDQRKGDDAVFLSPIMFRRSFGRRTVTVGPGFGWATRLSKDGKKVVSRAGLVGPIYWRTAPKSGDFVAFPLYFRSWNPRRSISFIPWLLTYRRTSPDGHLAIYGPLVDSKHKDSRTTALFPIFRYRRDSGGAAFASLPFFWWVRRGEHTKGFVGLGYWNTETGTRIWPLYVRVQNKHPVKGHVTRTTDVAFPLYWRIKTPERDIVVIPPYYRIKRADGSKVQGIAPIWSMERRPKTRYRSWSILGDLIGYERSGPHRRLTVLFGIHIPLKSKASASLTPHDVAMRRPGPAGRMNDLRADRAQPLEVVGAERRTLQSDSFQAHQPMSVP